MLNRDRTWHIRWHLSPDFTVAQFWREAFWCSFAFQFWFSLTLKVQNTILICVSSLAKHIFMEKWLTAGCFLCLLCPSFCLLLTRHLPVLANRCVPSHASHLAAASFLLLQNLRAAFAEVLKAVSSFHVTRKVYSCNTLKMRMTYFVHAFWCY